MYFVRNKRGGSESGAMGPQVYGKYINYLGDFCQLLHLQKVWTQIRPNRKPVVISIQNHLTLWVRDLKSLFLYRGQAVQALNMCSDCVFPITTFFRK